MALVPDPFEALLRLQRTMETLRDSDWLTGGPSGSGSFPPINAFRQNDEYILLAELPGVDRNDIDIQVKGNTIRLSGRKSPRYPEKASLHRRERLFGRFDRSVTLPVEIDADKVQAVYNDGMLALRLPQSEHEKPRQIQLS